MGNIDCCPDKFKNEKIQHLDFSFSSSKPIFDTKYVKTYGDSNPLTRNPKLMKKKYKKSKHSRRKRHSKSKKHSFTTATPMKSIEEQPNTMPSSPSPTPSDIFTDEELAQLLYSFNNNNNTFDNSTYSDSSNNNSISLHQRRASTSPDIDIEALMYFRTHPSMFSQAQENTTEENCRNNVHSAKMIVHNNQSSNPEPKNVQWVYDEKDEEMYEWIDSNVNQQTSEMEEKIEMLETLRNMTTAQMLWSERREQSYDDIDKQLNEQSYKSIYDIQSPISSRDWIMKDSENDCAYDEHMQVEIER